MDERHEAQKSALHPLFLLFLSLSRCSYSAVDRRIPMAYYSIKSLADAGQNAAPCCRGDLNHGDGKIFDDTSPKCLRIGCKHTGVPAVGKILSVASHKEDLGRGGRDRTVEVQITSIVILYIRTMRKGRGQVVLFPFNEDDGSRGSRGGHQLRRGIMEGR